MYKPLRIIIFIAVVLCIILLPVLANGGRAAAEPVPDLDTPEINSMADPACIESTEYMKTEHMHLLDNWRTEVVRDGMTEYTSSSGQIYEMSMEETCFGCHSNKTEFCASCHDYAGVDPNCWSCHVGEDVVVGNNVVAGNDVAAGEEAEAGQ